MRVAIGQIRQLSDEILRFGAQLGIHSVQLNTPFLAPDGPWSAEVLRPLVIMAQRFDMQLEAIENVPLSAMSQFLTGGPGAAQQLADYQSTIRAMGEVGIPILGHNFMPNLVWTTSHASGRGGARARRFDLAAVTASASGGQEFVLKRPGSYFTADPKRFLDADQMWRNYQNFLQQVLPVAREAGVRLALHPDDPPVPRLGGVARIFADLDGLKRAEEIAEATGAGQAWGLNLCLGTCSEMPGGADTVKAAIEYFGPRGKILYVHLRDVQGTVPAFNECFLGEGNYDPAEILLLLKKTGFSGFILDDHVPHMDADTDWGHRARAHALGYIQGLLNMINYVPSQVG